MKSWPMFLFVLIGFVYLGTTTSAQDKLERRVELDISRQLDLIIDRLESIERRLQKLEAADEPLAFPFASPIRQDNAIIRLGNPRAVISPSVDAGMLLDAYERNRGRTR